MIATFPTSYGLFGLILSTDGKLSRPSSYDIGIPKAGQTSGTNRRINSSREIFRFSFLDETCLQRRLSGFSILFWWSLARIASLFFILYSRMYSRCCSFVFMVPFLYLRSALLADWQLRQTFGRRPFLGVKLVSSFVCPHFIQVFMYWLPMLVLRIY